MIRRAFTFAPIALLTSACVNRAYTPSDLVALPSGENEPDPIERNVPARNDAAARWHLPPSSPWSGFERLTLVSALAEEPSLAELPNIEDLEVVRRARTAAQATARAGLPPRTMWLVDMRGAASVAFGAALSNEAREPVAPVLTFNNWPAEDELVPAEETLSALVSLSPTLPREGDYPEHPVFLLDAWRLAYKGEEIDDDVTDNRYMLSPTDLPSAEFLRMQGISSVIYVVEQIEPQTLEEDDLHATFIAYKEAGIRVQIVDLSWLIGLYGEPHWDRLETRELLVAPRVTIVEDPAFYVRAHGGFGGVHGVPVIAGHGGFYIGHGGG